MKSLLVNSTLKALLESSLNAQVIKMVALTFISIAPITASAAGISAGNAIAHTIGASCPLGSSISNMTAQWTLDRTARPTSAIAMHCDGFTESHYDISFPVMGGGCDGSTDPVNPLPEPNNIYGC
jgi:hypothetical protein